MFVFKKRNIFKSYKSCVDALSLLLKCSQELLGKNMNVLVSTSQLYQQMWKRFVSLIFISICFFVVCTLSKSSLDEAGGHAVLGPKISGLDFSYDVHLGFQP